MEERDKLDYFIVETFHVGNEVCSSQLTVELWYTGCVPRRDLIDDEDLDPSDMRPRQAIVSAY